MRSNLNNISIKEKDGTITDLGKKYGGVKERISSSAKKGGSSYEAGRDWQPGKEVSRVLNNLGSTPKMKA